VNSEQQGANMNSDTPTVTFPVNSFFVAAVFRRLDAANHGTPAYAASVENWGTWEVNAACDAGWVTDQAGRHHVLTPAQIANAVTTILSWPKRSGYRGVNTTDDAARAALAGMAVTGDCQRMSYALAAEIAQTALYGGVVFA
jgi:hypothetical protein